MSFTAGVKNELASLAFESECCKRSFVYGFLLYGKSFTARSVSCATDYAEVMQAFERTIAETSGVKTTVTRLRSGKYVLKIPAAEDRKRIIEYFDHAVNSISLRINRGVFEDDECYGSFLRGVFLSCGSIANPDKNYHLEFVIPFHNLSLDLLKILTDFGLKAKLILRKYSYVVYLKDSESIEDLLTLMGAVNSSLELMGIKIQKDVRNKINRQMNFESANMSRSIEAGLAQVKAIEIIEKKQGLDSLSDELKEVAILRRENPDMSLKQLGENLTVPISRSGVNHRLMKIIEIADKYR